MFIVEFYFHLELSQKNFHQLVLCSLLSVCDPLSVWTVQLHPLTACLLIQYETVTKAVITWDRYEIIPVRTQTGTESLHETGMKVTSDYMRPVWTQTGTTFVHMLKMKISDRSEISLRLHGKNCQTGLTHSCWFSSRNEANRSEVIFRTSLV